MPEEWFRTWFDTDYYHLLYEHRDEKEARQFIDALLQFLNPSEDARFLDVACGKGRHSFQLSEAGFKTTGIDLSENSIREASRFSNDRLRFAVQDIRESIPFGPYDFALNLFTSFGYFDSLEEHILSLKNIRDVLVTKGKLVIDFMNTEQAKGLVNDPVECTKHGVQFRISKTMEGNFMLKTIEVRDGNRKFDFQERVMAFSRNQLHEMIEQAGFSVHKTFGCYDLTPFDQRAERVIIIAEKI